ncbi:MAG: metal-dependent hydrolase [Dethiobacter sp.]|jgi:L-ascorbate metabolism protein UlaG (beta-lactamase superfamily)|nr:metal-dependent hydrolase [Dethiobacter sp.]
MARLTFYGHACFLFEKNGIKLLFDPFLSGNPQATVAADEVEADYIFVSHAHADHLGDTYEIAARTDAKIISTAEIAHECQNRGLNAHAMHIGGKFKFEFGYVRVTPAFHGSGISGGHACGFIVNLDGFTIYFAGDTGLFGDMKLFGEIEKIDLFLVPIGGNFTMDLDDAVYATKLTGTGTVVPCHYNTWPVVAADPDEFCTKVSDNTAGRCLVLAPGESADF